MPSWLAESQDIEKGVLFRDRGQGCPRGTSQAGLGTFTSLFQSVGPSYGFGVVVNYSKHSQSWRIFMWHYWA